MRNIILWVIAIILMATISYLYGMEEKHPTPKPYKPQKDKKYYPPEDRIYKDANGDYYA